MTEIKKGELQSPGYISPYMNTREAAKYLGLCPTTLEKRRWLGLGPCYRKHGTIVVYHIDDLENWSTSNLHNTNSK
ncbi:MAG: DNA-binding protein [Alphaproteobacteria bacterium]|nr:MAG: DNA-binding protein [Alphaproteobacteria bacterium]